MKIVTSKEEAKMVNKKLAELSNGIMAGLMMGAVNCMQSDDAIFERLCLNSSIKTNNILLHPRIQKNHPRILHLRLVPLFRLFASRNLF